MLDENITTKGSLLKVSFPWASHPSSYVKFLATDTLWSLNKKNTNKSFFFLSRFYFSFLFSNFLKVWVDNQGVNVFSHLDMEQFFQCCFWDKKNIYILYSNLQTTQSENRLYRNGQIHMKYIKKLTCRGRGISLYRCFDPKARSQCICTHLEMSLCKDKSSGASGE